MPCKCLLILWLQSPSAVILEPPKVKSATVFTVSPSICHELMGPDAMIFIFWMLSFKATFSLSTFTFIKKLFSSSSLSAIRLVSSEYLRLLISLPTILIPESGVKLLDCVKKAEHRRIDTFVLWFREDSWESLGLQGDPTSPFWRRSALGFLWKEWC